MGATPVPRISIFLNLFDVHVARTPVGGRVAARRYTKGLFVNASLDKASSDNERLAIRIARPDGPEAAAGHRLRADRRAGGAADRLPGL